MTKGKSKSAKNIFRTALFLLAVAVLSIGAWKARYLFNFSNAKIDMFREKADKMQTAYNSYKIKIHKAAGGIYYLKLEDLICDAAPDYDGSPHYFRLNITFETDREETAELLKSREKELTDNLRDSMKNLRLANRNGERIMNYIKSQAVRKAENIAGKNAVKGVYFESFLSQ